MTLVYRSTAGIFARDAEASDGALVSCPDLEWNEIFRRDDPQAYVRSGVSASRRAEEREPPAESLLPLVDRQEVWAAGVTYFRSRTARMEESQEAGGDSFYDRVYEADRPELFYKGNARTVVAAGSTVRIRSDASWNVPEPELTLAVNAAGRIIGYTAGNDMSSRDIEGENPLYLPQAKVYDGSCALGPALLLSSGPIDRSVAISVEITRGGSSIFTGRTSLEDLKRDPEELVGYLFRSQRFPDGCYLMTGTGIVPDDSFTLESGDVVSIAVGDLPPLVNTVEEAV